MNQRLRRSPPSDDDKPSHGPNISAGSEPYNRRRGRAPDPHRGNV